MSIRWLHLLLLGFLLAAVPCGCGPAPLPPNPILENGLAHLQAVETRIRANPHPVPADYLELGMARYQVWTVYWGRAHGVSDRGAAPGYLKQAQRMEPQVYEAFGRAMDSPADPPTAAEAKRRLVLMYEELQDWDKASAMLQRILREHGDLNAPGTFGQTGTPQSYCYYTLYSVYQRQNQRRAAVDAAARALLAWDAAFPQTTALDAHVASLLEPLLDYEPRLTVPRYQTFLPARIDEPLESSGPNRHGPAPALERILRLHRDTAPVGINLTVEHADYNGLFVRYEVLDPGYPAMMKAWENQPPSPLEDSRPAFHLAFRMLPATDGFEVLHDPLEPLSGYTKTPDLVFDGHGRAAGGLVLKWADGSGSPRHFYVTAKLTAAPAFPARAGAPLRSPPSPPRPVYIQPVEVQISPSSP